MKPKYTTGYTSPQVTDTRQNLKASNSNVESGIMLQINDSLFEKMMSCPIKRNLILSLIDSEKDNIEEYKKNMKKRELHGNTASPLKRLQKRPQCESPTAIMRRRALEQQKSKTTGDTSDSCSDKTESRSSSRQSIAVHSPMPYNKLLKGVVAYVEIKCNDQDRSAGVKALTLSMGATVRDIFARDVTHVIFKDGSFTTYQKANLMKIHLVSVLWLEACKNSGMKVSESRFPALGTDAYDHNVSAICSQMQKEYEEIIKEEYHRSLVTGTPLPTTKSFINRRRTITTPSISHSSQDREVANITSQRWNTQIFKRVVQKNARSSPEYSSDDDSYIALVDGNISTRKMNNTGFDHIVNDSMDLTSLSSKMDSISEQNITSHTSNVEETPKNRRSKGRKVAAAEVLDEENRKSSTEEMFSLKLPFSPKVKILSKNVSVASPNMLKNHAPSTMSSLQTISDKNNAVTNKSMSTNMSTLQISEKSTSMSALQISTESEKTRTEMNQLKGNNSQKRSTNDNSFNSLSPPRQDISDLLELLDEKLDTVDNITRRKKCTTEKNSNPKKSAETQKLEDKSDESIGRGIRYSRRRTIHSLMKTVETSPQKSESDSSESECNKNRKARKLYNPNDSMYKLDLCDEKERENKRLMAKNQKSDEGVFIKPNIIPIKQNILVSQEAMNFMEKHNLDMDNILDKKSDKLEIGVVVKKKGKKQQEIKEKVYDDEQRELSREVLAEKHFLGSSHNKCRKDIDEDSRNIEAETKIGICDVEKTIHNNLSTPKKSKTDENQMKTPQNTFKMPKSSKSLPRKKANTKTTPHMKTVSQSVGPQRRSSVRISERTPKKIDSNSTSNDNDNCLNNSRNRRSSLEFQPKTMPKRTHLKIDRVKKPSIVCTKMSSDDIQVFSQIVKKLGNFIIEDEVTSQTTHLVAGEPKRTINMLRGIANGCWILKKEWLFKSLEAGKWLPEEDFEETGFSDVVQKSRMQRQAFGPSYSLDIFSGCGPIYVAKDTTPRCSDLRELVGWCQGKDARNPSSASIVVGELADGVTCVTVNWILDSITFGRKMPFRKYFINSKRCSIVV